MTLQKTGILEAIPFLGALGLGAQKILPLMQQSWAAISTIRGNQNPLEDTINLLEQSTPIKDNRRTVTPLVVDNEIVLKNISFRYNSKAPFVINNFNLRIKKGSRIGFVGKTGSGKSTIMDIVMGLLQPSKGIFQIDEKIVTKKNIRNWQKNVAHVPQVIFLSDTSIAEIIAFVFLASTIGIQPLPVPISSAEENSSFNIQSTNSSVSGLGINVCSFTLNFSP